MGAEVVGDTAAKNQVAAKFLINWLDCQQRLFGYNHEIMVCRFSNLRVVAGQDIVIHQVSY
ncbi:MAG: hypothetical protein JST85_17820 [Acidobacteria bacterium]|nr:hypothetical protein [Acidobacteriota bacterium]